MGCSSSREATTTRENAASPSNPDRFNPSRATQELAGKVVEGVSGLLNPTLAINALRPIGENLKKQGDRFRSQGNRHLRNIFAKPLQDVINFASFNPPVHPKTDTEKDFIEVALKMNFVFQNLTSRSLETLVLAFEKCSFEKGHTIIKQGDAGDYFYIVDTGMCEFLINDKQVGTAGPGDSFGELALLYTCPRAATVRAMTSPTTLFRVDQATFRYILRSDTEKGQEDKQKLLEGVKFLKDLSPQQLDKLVNVMTPKRFVKGDYLMKKGDEARHFSILKEGEAIATEITVGNAKYEDIAVKAGDHFGERALVTGETRAGNVIAVTDGLAFQIDKASFESVLGDLKDLILRSQDLTRLSGIKVIADSCLDPMTLSSLAKLVDDKDIPKGTKLTQKNKPGLAAVYLVRKGRIEITDSNGTKSVEMGAHFGEQLLLADQHASNSKQDPTQIPATFTATVVEDCTVGILTLSSCRRVLNTTYLGGPAPLLDSLKERGLNPDELERHKILGAGTFGQVWLVSRTASSTGTKRAYALKVQSKYELCQDGQAAAVVHEKNIMAELRHPFLIALVGSYQDEQCVFMLMELVQGGELGSVMHTPKRNLLPEKEAIFYVAAISEGLGFMHRRGYVYRDLKPENVLINDKGYCVIIDFGFVKKVRRKTYTLCGTPLYMAPEVILNRGHNWGADHWSLGVLIYEMLTGRIPFYEEGMDQMGLFRAIVEGAFSMPSKISKEAKSILTGFLTTNPAKRLGSLAGGEDDILEHAWFADIDFGKLRNQEIDAPFIPNIKDPLDSSNFEDWSFLQDKTETVYPELTQQQKEIFVKF